jgi:hypothetical protein
MDTHRFCFKWNFPVAITMLANTHKPLYSEIALLKSKASLVLPCSSMAQSHNSDNFDIQPEVFEKLDEGISHPGFLRFCYYLCHDIVHLFRY